MHTPGARLDEIVIVPYDPRWPKLFEAQRARVAEVLAPVLVGAVEHIGSTAVPGLPAKPIIDMLARVTDHAAAGAVVTGLAALGWVAAPEPSDGALRRWSYCFPDVARRSHHLHVVEHVSDGWPTWLAFRDRLRADPAAASGYAALKAELAARDRHDRVAYRAGKAPFIEGVLDS
ncbi:GrpB family protein [Catellatospora sichuanensis]|uniref:GrpB family protein n=1 Tax=Catellatospora sichuanensis TaxID=1969805 RepID=UPI001182D204|nr:GrpB family protein [Catellatospora sichuanensis]